MRRYPVIKGSNALAMKLLEGDIGDAQRDDPHQSNRLWCPPDHPRVRYGTIYDSRNEAVLHVGDLRWTPVVRQPEPLLKV